jgi:hypothetical protein
MTDEELDALDEVYDTMMEVQRNPTGAWRAIQDQADAITTLRAQLAEARANEAALAEIRKTLAAPDDWHPVDAVKALKRSHDRAEAALAAQIEASAGIANAAAKHAAGKATKAKALGSDLARSWSDVQSHMMLWADAIRSQPHDRTALDRHDAKTREKALREAADTVTGWHPIAAGAIRALIEKPNAS